MIPKLIIHPQIDVREQYVHKHLAEHGFDLTHPDLMYIGPEEKLGMEQAKKIKNFLKLKPYQAKGQTIVLTSADNLTMDAQNALLKTLEEHAEEVTFLLGASAEDQLLSTLVSRCQIINLQIDHGPEKENKYQKEIEKLLISTIEQRFQFIEKLKEKDELLPALTAYFRHKLPGKKWMNFLKDLVLAEKWAKQNVNIRAILEYLMLKMPKN